MNPAERLIKILDKMNSYPSEHRMLQMWASVFDIEVSGEHVEEEITICLMALKREIEITRTMLASKGVPAENATTTLNRLRDTTLPSRLSRPWKEQAGNLGTPDNRLTLQWSAWALESESEGDLAPEAREELKTELLSLEESLAGVEMAPVLRNFVQQQIDAIRKALRLYDLQGARPFEETLKAATAETIFRKDALQAAYNAAPTEGKTAFGRALSILKKTAEVADGLVKVKKFGDEAVSLSQAVMPLLRLLS